MKLGWTHLCPDLRIHQDLYHAFSLPFNGAKESSQEGYLGAFDTQWRLDNHELAFCFTSMSADCSNMGSGSVPKRKMLAFLYSHYNVCFRFSLYGRIGTHFANMDRLRSENQQKAEIFANWHSLLWSYVRPYFLPSPRRSLVKPSWPSPVPLPQVWFAWCF